MPATRFFRRRLHPLGEGPLAILHLSPQVLHRPAEVGVLERWLVSPRRVGEAAGQGRVVDPAAHLLMLLPDAGADLVAERIAHVGGRTVGGGLCGGRRDERLRVGLGICRRGADANRTAHHDKTKRPLSAGHYRHDRTPADGGLIGNEHRFSNSLRDRGEAAYVSPAAARGGRGCRGSVRERRFPGSPPPRAARERRAPRPPAGRRSGHGR